MRPKTLLIIITVLMLTFIVLMIAAYGVYNYYPSVVGLPPRYQDTCLIDTVWREPTIEVTTDKLEDYQVALVQKAYLKNQKDSVIYEQNKLLDSLGKIRQSIEVVKDSIAKVLDTLSYSRAHGTTLQDSLKKMHDSLAKTINEIKLTKQRINDQEKFIDAKYDSLEKVNFITFAKIYENSNPTEVARILEQIDERDAAMILKAMQKKKAGKILEVMKPEQAAAILLMGGTQ